MSDHPNLFTFAKSELSQDAFFCWLVMWADARHCESDPELHSVSRRLISSMAAAANRTVESWGDIQVATQFRGIDILVEINPKVVLLIEDKTTTAQHSNQLERYLQLLRESKEYAGRDVIPIYLKTGDQSHLDEVVKAGFFPFMRADVLAALDAHGSQIRNDVFRQFVDYLRNWEAEVQRFRTVPPGPDFSRWKGNSMLWIGLFSEFQRRFDLRWDYVPNQAGGFMGAWWFVDRQGEVESYLQLEEERLCFKVSIGTDNSLPYRDIRTSWNARIIGAAHSNGQTGVTKPPRFGTGAHMTVAIYENWARFSPDGCIDIDETVNSLRQAEVVLRSARSIDK